MRSEYTEEFEGFSQAYVREIYLYESGRKTRFEIEPVFDRYGYLFRSEEIADLGAAADGAYLERDRKAYAFLRAAAAERHLDAAARPLTEEIAAHATRATVSWQGRDVPLRATPALIAREPRPDARHELAARRARAVEETNDLRAERFERRRDAAVALGADSYLALRTKLTGVDYAELARASRRLLDATERPYVEALEPALAARAGVRPAEATRADALRAFRLEEFDAAFTRARLPVVYRDALGGLGIRTGAQPNVRLDLDERPTKSPRAFCAAIRVPDEVVLAVRPSGGYADYRALLHEAGPAQHFGFTSPETRVAFARAGDAATSETYAFLLQGLLSEQEFLGEVLGARHTGDLGRLVGLERAYSVRRHAGKTIYEEALHGSGSLAGARERYAEALFDATRVEPAAAEYLADVDDGLYVAAYMRACALEVRLRDHLKTRFGRRWWTNRAAGALLKEIWATGNEYTADDLAAELGLGALSFDALEHDLVEGLKP